jgi:hypothetical protein
MSANQLKLQAAALALGIVLIVACEETDDAVHPTGFNDQEDLGQCTLEFTNETGYSLTHGQFFPTDSFGILKELPNLPIAFRRPKYTACTHFSVGQNIQPVGET